MEEVRTTPLAPCTTPTFMRIMTGQFPNTWTNSQISVINSNARSYSIRPTKIVTQAPMASSPTTFRKSLKIRSPSHHVRVLRFAAISILHFISDFYLNVTNKSTGRRLPKHISGSRREWSSPHHGRRSFNTNQLCIQ